jgi:hypothetical protein
MYDFGRLAFALVSASVVATASCARLHPGEDQPVAQVIFVNQSLDQASVFAVLGEGQSQRIGTVFAGRTDTLDIPANIISNGGTVTIVARLLARSVAPRTGPLTILAGDQFRVTLPSSGQLLSVLPAR